MNAAPADSESHYESEPTNVVGVDEAEARDTQLERHFQRERGDLVFSASFASSLGGGRGRLESISEDEMTSCSNSDRALLEQITVLHELNVSRSRVGTCDWNMDDSAQSFTQSHAEQENVNAISDQNQNLDEM